MNDQQASTSILPFAMEAYDDVYALWQRCEGVGLSGADGKENIAAYLARNPGMSFTAWLGERLIGAILCGHDGRRGYIHHLAVDEKYRRQGIGRQLVKRSLGTLRQTGIQKCHLFIFHLNQAGIDFWRSCGWTLRQDIQVMSAVIEKQEE